MSIFKRKKKKHPEQWTLTPAHPDYQPFIKWWMEPIIWGMGLALLPAYTVYMKINERISHNRTSNNT